MTHVNCNDVYHYTHALKKKKLSTMKTGERNVLKTYQDAYHP